MDNYREIGNYYCSANSIANTLINSPFTKAFTMKVEFSQGTSYPCQICKAYDTGIIARRYYDISKWSDWSYFSDDETLFAGKAINSGDDLNDYTTPGIYRSTSSSTTASLLNIPEIFNSGFSMLVFNMSLATNVQVIFAGDNMYMRTSNIGVWKSWFKYSGAVISS